MKYRLLFLISFILIVFSLDNVSASDINYNIKIDKSMHLYETITYNIAKKDVKRDGDYHFLTSIVDDPVYFDLNKELKYKKTKTSTTNGYLVTLKHDYSYLFLSKSRIVNECFANNKVNANGSYISFTASDFYCSHRADSINVSITTDLYVLNSNAKSVNGNNYTWNNVSNNFSINFAVQLPRSEENPMDDDNEQSNDGNNSSSSDENVKKEKKHINKYVVLGVIGVLVFGVITVFIILKTRNNELNKI